jgi:hypothetical protein
LGDREEGGTYKKVILVSGMVTENYVMVSRIFYRFLSLKVVNFRMIGSLPAVLERVSELG